MSGSACRRGSLFWEGQHTSPDALSLAGVGEGMSVLASIYIGLWSALISQVQRPSLVRVGSLPPTPMVGDKGRGQSSGKLEFLFFLKMFSEKEREGKEEEGNR